MYQVYVSGSLGGGVGSIFVIEMVKSVLANVNVDKKKFASHATIQAKALDAYLVGHSYTPDEIGRITVAIVSAGFPQHLESDLCQRASSCGPLRSDKKENKMQDFTCMYNYFTSGFWKKDSFAGKELHATDGAN